MAHDEGKRGDLEHRTLPGLVANGAARFGERLAVDGLAPMSYAGLAAAVRQAARALMASGVERGDRVAIWAPNSARWIVAALAVTAAGGVLVPINTRFRGEEAAFVLAKSGAKVLFMVHAFLGTDYEALLGRAETKTPALKLKVLLSDEAETLGLTDWATFVAKASEVSADLADVRALGVEPGDLSDCLFTSGTTGAPKGVLATHAQTLRAYRDWADVVGLREGDRYLVVLPFFHSFGYKAGVLASLMMGATILPQPVFDVDQVLARIARDKVSVLPGPPALYQTILARPDLASFDLSSLRLAVTGAATIPVDLIVRMRERLTFKTIVTGYGLTESGGIATMCREGDDAETIAQTSGRAIPGVEVRVVDPEGHEVTRGEPGEVVVRGYNVTKGYLNDAEETAKAVDAEGFLHTGDIGVMDQRGYLKITDRLKDMFIVGGFNAYPAEIEAALLKHDALAQAAVVGAPDERLGEVGVAFVVVRAGARTTPEELEAFCRARMANYKVPRRFEIVAALPTNATGKVLKYELRAKARAQASA